MLSLTYNSSLFIHVSGDMRIFFQLDFDVVVVLVGFFFFAYYAGFVGVLRVVLPPKKIEWKYYHQLKALSKRFN